jgi:putative membrane protein
MTATGGIWWGGGWGIIEFLLMIAFWTLVVVLIVGLVRGRGGAPRGGPSTALHVLEERYARGEIDREEFMQRRAVLTGQRPDRTDPGEPTEPTTPTT